LAASDRPAVEPDRIALAVQQPWAELIVRRVKTIEIRSTPCRAHGRIYIYASRRPSTLPDAAEAAARFGLDPVGLPGGVIVGTAELTGCRAASGADASAACVGPDRLDGRFAWTLASAERFKEPLRARFLPYGIWFYPFRRKGENR